MIAPAIAEEDTGYTDVRTYGRTHGSIHASFQGHTHLKDNRQVEAGFLILLTRKKLTVLLHLPYAKLLKFQMLYFRMQNCLSLKFYIYGCKTA